MILVINGQRSIHSVEATKPSHEGGIGRVKGVHVYDVTSARQIRPWLSVWSPRPGRTGHTVRRSWHGSWCRPRGDWWAAVRASCDI